MSTLATRKFTPDDLLTMPDGDNYELVGGDLVERTMGAKSSYFAGRIYSLLLAFCDHHQLGWVFPEGTSYQCFPAAPGKVRRADTSFVPFEDLPSGEPPEGHLSVSPRLAVEVVSPHDRADEVEEKVQEYLAAGVELVWVASPTPRTVRVYRADGSGVILRADDEITGEAVLPGFRCRVSEFFVLPAPPAGGAELPPR